MAKFSDRFILNLKPKMVSYQVRDSKGFVLRVLPSGTKTFLYIYEKNGKRKQLNLGIYPNISLAEAREAYEYAQKALLRGEPLLLPPASFYAGSTVTTVLDLQTKYLAHLTACKFTSDWIYINKSVMNNHLKEWHKRDVTSLTKTDAIALIKGIQEKGISGRNVYKMFHAMFEYAVSLELIPVSPFYKVTKALSNMGTVYKTRVLSESDIKHIWSAIDLGEGPEAAKRILKLILVTGQRPGEVLGMHRREISEEASGVWWIIPPERALKGKRHHRVYLTSTALELIGDSEGYIFPATRKSTTEHIIKTTVSQVVNVSNSYGLPKWTPHDLRRTARTHMARIGIPEEHAEAVLNHSKKGMVQVYNQYGYDTEKKEAMLRWEREIIRILGHGVEPGKPSNIVNTKNEVAR